MLGMRNRDHSYVVGTGKGPKRPGDRAASCPLDFDVECNRWAALAHAVCNQLEQTVTKGHCRQLDLCFETAFWQCSLSNLFCNTYCCGRCCRCTCAIVPSH